MYAETPDLFDKAWQRLVKEFNDQKAILIYLQDTYICLRSQWARSFTREYPNLGQKTTSPTESNHYGIKSYLLNGNSTIFRLFQAILEMIAHQKRTYEDDVEKQKVRLRREYLNKAWLGDVPLKVSYWAVDQIVTCKLHEGDLSEGITE